MDRGKAFMGVIGGLVSGLAVTAGSLAILRALRTPPGPPPKPPGLVRVIARSAMTTGQIFIDGEPCGSGRCELDLKPGLHQAEVRRPGYTGEAREFTAKSGVDFELSLEPLPSAVEVVSDLLTGELRLDDQPPVPMTAGGVQIAHLAPGEHRLRFSSGAFRAEVKFEVHPGVPPRLLTPPAASGLRAIVIAGAGPQGRLWLNEKNVELAIGARELGLIPEQGLALPAMERGVHRFVLKPANGKEVAFVYEIAENPTAWISLRTNRKLGTLRILTNVADDAKVILDGKDSGARTRRGRALLLATPGRHEVLVEKAGFLMPLEQKAAVEEGGETELEFNLEPVPTRAMLPVAGAPAGAALFVDDRPAGTAGVDGGAVLSDLDPGTRVVTARRDGYVAGRWEVRLGAGRNPVLRAAMQRAPATLRIVTLPASADVKLTIRRLGQFEERALNETSLQLPEGEYTVTAVDAKGQRVSTRVRLEAGQEATATLTLGAPAPQAEPAQVSSAAKRLSLNDWDGAPGWNRQGDRIVTEGGGILLAPTHASAQSLTFTAHPLPGRGLRWVTQFRDSMNYTLYELRGDGLNRTDVVRGKRIQRNHAHLARAATDPVRVRMNQQAGVLHTSVFRGGQWVSLDAAEAPNGTGRFGFYLPERDKLALSEFQYEYR